jgi:uncharacterized repeat protein (TIGR03803 family)
VLYSFAGGPDGAYPLSELLIKKNGALIGTTSQGGDLSGCGGKGCGVVFELTPAPAGNNKWKETVLYQFAGGTDGAAPLAGVLMDKTGALYGVTSEGGGGGCHSYVGHAIYPFFRTYWTKAAKVGCGTIFKLTPPTVGHPVWTEVVLYAFRGDGGRFARSVPLMDTTGALYGVTFEGGEGRCGYWAIPWHSSSHRSIQFRTGCGTVFHLTPPAVGNAWSLTTLHQFTGKNDGVFPVGGVIFGPKGSLLGTTGSARGSSSIVNLGTVFKLTPPTAGRTVWTQTILYAFPEGASPPGGLYQDRAGALFGTTGLAEAAYGAAFQLSPPSTGDRSWTENILHKFRGGRDGAAPSAGLIRDPATGVFYGVTEGGGGIGCSSSSPCGTVFSLTPPAAGKTSWTEAVLHRFGRPNDGGNPQARLTMDKAGNLYGTTAMGGAPRHGTVFKVSP